MVRFAPSLHCGPSPGPPNEQNSLKAVARLLCRLPLQQSHMSAFMISLTGAALPECRGARRSSLRPPVRPRCYRGGRAGPQSRLDTSGARVLFRRAPTPYPSPEWHSAGSFVHPRPSACASVASPERPQDREPLPVYLRSCGTGREGSALYAETHIRSYAENWVPCGGAARDLGTERVVVSLTRRAPRGGDRERRRPGRTCKTTQRAGERRRTMNRRMRSSGDVGRADSCGSWRPSPGYWARAGPQRLAGRALAVWRGRCRRRLALDPTTPTTLYAGTAQGVFKTTDAGTSWSPATAG